MTVRSLNSRLALMGCPGKHYPENVLDGGIDETLELINEWLITMNQVELIQWCLDWIRTNKEASAKKLLEVAGKTRRD